MTYYRNNAQQTQADPAHQIIILKITNVRIGLFATDACAAGVASGPKQSKSGTKGGTLKHHRAPSSETCPS
jgi:hypothetical protein